MRMTRNTAAPAPGREENNEPAKPKQPQPPADPGAGLALIPAIQTIVPAEFFKPNGSDAVLAALEANVRALAADLDISTEAGRKAIASLAYRVACSKTPLDDLGEALIVESRAFVAQVNEGRKAVRERIDALKVEVRQPLTDWENADKARVDAHETAILALEERAAWANDNWQRAPLDLLKDTLHANQVFTRDWQEFKKRGEFAHQQAAASLVDAIERREKYEADQAELKELRRQQAEREQKEREAEIARRAQEAERARAEAAAAESRQAAVEAERARVAAETEKARIEQAARERNKRHRAAIEAGAIQAIRLHLVIDMNVDPSKELDLDLAKAVVKAISEGLVPNVTINY